MTPAPTKFLVIGAGPVGLAVARALKGRGISYDQIESADGVGGNWHHGVYQSARIISSRRTTEFPEFPMPADWPDFPDRRQMLDYLTAYAQHFGLVDQIELGKSATHVAQAANGTWEVVIGDGETRRYRGVIVCVGHHWDRRWPGYPGALSAQYIHSKDYQTVDQLRGKRVLVIGGGNSACDIVSEAARVGASAHLSLRRGYWFLPKVLFGQPIVDLMRHYTPVWAQRVILRLALRVAVGKYRRYGLPTPDHRLFEKHPVISSELFFYLKNGQIVVHPDVRKFDGHEVEFVDGTRAAFDIVVAATGFHLSFPFLAPALVAVTGPVVEVYGNMMATIHRHLYIMGWQQPRYGFGPLLAPVADLLADVIEIQDRMKNPIGLVLKRLGQRPPRTSIFDPFRIRLGTRWTRRLLPLVLHVDRWIRPTLP